MAHNLDQYMHTDSYRPITRSMLCPPDDVVPGNYRGCRMPVRTIVVAAPLGANVAAFTCRVRGQPAAVVNVAAGDDPALRTQAALALAAAGIDAGTILGALDGIRR